MRDSDEAPGVPSSSRFRFKSRARSRSPRRTSHRKHKKRASGVQEPPESFDDKEGIYNARSGVYVQQDSLFRESLFDALADDEGAAYWEEVYGQPMHVYSDVKVGPNGEMERMDDDQYADYVRQKMWEKTHQHVIEERKKRERDRERQRKKRTKDSEDQVPPDHAEDYDVFLKTIDRSLRRSEDRKRQQKWQKVWEDYVKRWENFINAASACLREAELSDKDFKKLVPWPVDTGQWKHVAKEDIESFFSHAVPSNSNRRTILKAERVRWHPDKMQQRLGPRRADSEVTAKITMVFQVVDAMYSRITETCK